MSTWQLPNPDKGSTESLERIAAFLTESARQLGFLHSEMIMILNNVTPRVWSGRAHDAWDESVRSCVTGEATRMQAKHESASRAIGAYVEKFNLIKSAMNGVREQVAGIILCGTACGFLTYVGPQDDDWYGWFEVSGDACVDYGSMPAVTFASTQAVPPLPTELPRNLSAPSARWTLSQRARDFQAWADFFNAELKEQVYRMLDEADERTAADSAVNAALEKALPTGWAEREQLASGLGLRDPADMTDRQIAITMADGLKRQCSLSEYAEELDRLEAFCDAYGSDSMVMAAFIDRLGPQDLEHVVVRVGSQTKRDGYAAACRLRDAFAVATHAWDADHAAEYVDEMFDEIEHSSDNRVLAIAMLFGRDYTTTDNSMLIPSREVALRAADNVDAFEARNGPLVYEDYSYLGSYMILDRKRQCGVGGSAIDASGAVLMTLAQYPTDLATWLYNGDDDQRVGRFFHRDWGSSGDGYRTPAQMLLTTQLVATARPSDELEKASVAVTSWALKAMVAGETSNTIHAADICPQAAMNFAAAAMLVEPKVEKTLLFPADLKSPVPKDITQGYFTRPGVDELLPAIENEDFAAIVKYGSMHPEGQAVIDAVVDRRVTEILDMGNGDMTGEERWELASALQGAQLGAKDAAGIDAARALDHQAQARIDRVVALVSALPVSPPGSSAMTASAARAAADYMTTWTFNEAVGWAGENAPAPRTGSWSTGNVTASAMQAAAEKKERMLGLDEDVRVWINSRRDEGYVFGTTIKEHQLTARGYFNLYYDACHDARGDH